MPKFKDESPMFFAIFIMAISNFLFIHCNIAILPAEDKTNA